MKTCLKKWQKKLRSASGETLVETLFAMLIIALAVVMLAGSIVSAARVNKAGADMVTEFQKSDSDKVEDGSVQLDFKDAAQASVDVRVYTTSDDNAYRHYEENS